MDNDLAMKAAEDAAFARHETGRQDLIRQAVRTGIETFAALADDVDWPSKPPVDPGPDVPGDGFRIYESIVYQDGTETDFSAYGAKSATFIYDSKLRTHGGHLAPMNLDTVRTAAKHKGVIAYDRESLWPSNEDYPRLDSRAAAIFNEACVVHAENRVAGNVAGWYGWPLREQNSIRQPGSTRFKEWRASNDMIAPGLQLMDLLLPSVYVLTKDMELYKDFCIAQIEECRRVAPNVPVVPVVWERWHPNVPDLNRQLLPGDYQRVILETIGKHADGICFWTESSKTRSMAFPSDSAWWKTTEAWLEART